VQYHAHGPWELRYKNSLYMHLKHIYRFHFGASHYKTLQVVRNGRSYWIPTTDHEVLKGTRLPYDQQKVEKMLKELHNMDVFTINGPGTDYFAFQKTTSRRSSVYKKFHLRRAGIDCLSKVGFGDRDWPILKAYHKGKWYLAHPSHAIGMAHRYPQVWRPWTKPVDIEEKLIPYLGMIDDDLMYDFRKENPFDTILSQNKEGPFLYVYDFDMYRERTYGWKLHDRFLHGFQARGEEEEKNPIRLTYGPVIDNGNHEIVRQLRAFIFMRLYLAKLRLGKMLHPAPQWIEENGDYTMKYGSHRRGTVMTQKIDPVIAAKTGVSLAALRSQIFRAPNEDYFRVLNKNIAIPEEAIDALKSKDWDKAKLWARIARYQEAFRDLYMHKMFVRSPIQKANDFLRYYTPKRLSIAMWDGQSGYGDSRFAFRAGLKFHFPYFERKDKRGNLKRKNVYDYGYFLADPTVVSPNHMGAAYSRGLGKYRDSSYRSAPSNTTGIIYAGHMEGSEFTAYCRSVGKTPKQVWESALKGPFMVISSRTYRRYGHAYFERLAGHKLKKVDVTGALIASAARVRITVDPDLLTQLSVMDYFYYKKNATEMRGKKAMLPASAIRPTARVPRLTGKYDPVRNARTPVTREMKKYTRDRSVAFASNIDRKYGRVIRDIQRGLAKDRRSFRGMSLRRTSYLPYHKEKTRKAQNGEWLFYPTKREICESVRLSLGGRGYVKNYVPPATAVWMMDAKLCKTVVLPRVGKDRSIRKGSSIWELSATTFKRLYDHHRDVLVDSMVDVKRTPRTIEFTYTVKRMKKERVVEQLKARYGSGSRFIYQLQLVLADRIPWLAYNPHMFLAYYKHSDAIYYVAEALTHHIWMQWKKDADARNHEVARMNSGSTVSDGTMVWSNRGHYTGSYGAVDYAAAPYAKKSQRYALVQEYHGLLGASFATIAGGKYRKQFARADFPWWETWVGNGNGNMFLPWDYGHCYKFMRNHYGYPNFMRDPSWMINQGGLNHQRMAELYSRMFPGILRYVNNHIITASSLSMWIYHTKEVTVNTQHGMSYEYQWSLLPNGRELPQLS